MSAQEWREKARAASEPGAVELELPSGMKIRARRPGPLQFAAWDRLPQILASAIDGDGAVSLAEAPEQTLTDLAGFLRDLLVWCCLEPRVALEPRGEDEIHPREIPEQDWLFVVAWAMRTEAANALRPFRSGGEDGRDHSGGESLSGEAE